MCSGVSEIVMWLPQVVGVERRVDLLVRRIVPTFLYSDDEEGMAVMGKGSDQAKLPRQ